MIRGHFATLGTRRRPFVKGVLHFPTLSRDLELRLLVDTGADRTISALLTLRDCGRNSVWTLPPSVAASRARVLADRSLPASSKPS